MVVKMARSCVPMLLAAATITIDIIAAIKAYSIAVAPDASAAKWLRADRAASEAAANRLRAWDRPTDRR